MTNPLILIQNDRKEIRKLTRRQDEDYTTVCLFNYDYIKNCYRLIPVDLTRKKSLDNDPKEIEFVGRLKKYL